MAALWLPASHQLGGFFGSLQDRVHVRVGLRPSADNLLLSVREVAVKVSLSHSFNEGLGHPSPVSVDAVGLALRGRERLCISVSSSCSPKLFPDSRIPTHPFLTQKSAC